ncbi:Dabb family protein [Actinomadura craniellae]|uniref:Dabb family protein n=1 Tax=Actinomadura craniellae TaxID=2231787 RepID=A0A365GYS1_9ACTN|nr:Dabb family protein [Actinomadura craniellae]RAY11962.1 Dabb family protein [Actinomadura craniellae]
MSGFRHVVMFVWAEGTTTAQRQEVADRLSELPAKIPQIASYSMGTNAGINPGTYDFVVVADFAGVDDYLVYRDHPVHRAVIEETITPIVERRSAIQYELG